MDISVVIPVYNVKEYLQKAVESLEKQHVDQMEIILIDDGSTDGTGIIVDSLADEYKNVSVIHQENSGAAVARNNGIQRARGKYLYFMDPDDWMEENMLQNLLSVAERSSAQLVISGFTNEYFLNNKYFSTQVSLKNHVFNKDEFRVYSPVLLNNTTLAVPWNKLYLASYIKTNELYFPNVKWDDLHFNMDVIKNIQRVATVEDTSYHFYRTRPGSETTKVFDGRLFANRKKQFEHILQNYRAWGLFDNPEVMSSVYYYYAARILQVIQEITDSRDINHHEKILKVKEVLNDNGTKLALEKGRNGSWTMQLCFNVLKSSSVFLVLTMGRMISLVKKWFSGFFYAKRVKVMQNE